MTYRVVTFQDRRGWWVIEGTEPQTGDVVFGSLAEAKRHADRLNDDRQDRNGWQHDV